MKNFWKLEFGKVEILEYKFYRIKVLKSTLYKSRKSKILTSRIYHTDNPKIRNLDIFGIHKSINSKI